MNPSAGRADGLSSSDESAVARVLQDHAALISPRPSADFVGRVMLEVGRSPLPIAARGPRPRVVELANAAGTRFRVALAQVAGGSSIPVRVRLQAALTLVMVALLITAGGVLAAAGAVSVADWVSGRQSVPVVASPTAMSPTQGQDPSANLKTDDPQRTQDPTSEASAGTVPDPGISAGTDPDSGSTTCNPGKDGVNGQSPDPTIREHASCNPGVHGKPSQRPQPTPRN